MISENQGFIEHHGRRLDRGGSRTGMMGSPRHGVSPLQAPVLVENSSAAGPLFLAGPVSLEPVESGGKAEDAHEA